MHLFLHSFNNSTLTQKSSDPIVSNLGCAPISKNQRSNLIMLQKVHNPQHLLPDGFWFSFVTKTNTQYIRTYTHRGKIKTVALELYLIADRSLSSHSHFAFSALTILGRDPLIAFAVKSTLSRRVDMLEVQQTEQILPDLYICNTFSLVSYIFIIGYTTIGNTFAIPNQCLRENAID